MSAIRKQLQWDDSTDMWPITDASAVHYTYNPSDDSKITSPTSGTSYGLDNFLNGLLDRVLTTNDIIASATNVNKGKGILYNSGDGITAVALPSAAATNAFVRCTYTSAGALSLAFTTTNYAGSSSDGGAANAAVKLNGGGAGQIVYQSGANATAFLAAGSAGDILTYDGTNNKPAWTSTHKVTQTATTGSAAYEILFSGTADNTTRAEEARKTSTLTYNPSTKALSTGGIVNGLTLSAQTTGFKISGGTTSKTLTVGADYTLAAACAKGVFDKSSATAVGSSGTNLVTERAVYYALPTINGAHDYTSSTTLFAPTSAGTSGQILVSNGNGAPEWATTENYTTTTIAAANYSLSNAEWTALTNALPTTSGTYALYIDDSTNGSYAGIFAIEGGAKEKIDEIPLHWATAATTTADSTRIYAAVKEGKLQLSSNNSSATTYNLTIKYKRII